MRKWLWGLAAVALLAGIGFFGIAPPIVEAGMNKVVPAPLPKVTEATRALHASLQIVDMHGDTLLWRRSLLDRAERGQVDLPRLIEGNVALQIFSSVTKTPKGQNYDSNPPTPTISRC
jgi:membrane dipeptidase